MSDATTKDWKKFKEENSLPDDLGLEMPEQKPEAQPDGDEDQVDVAELDHLSYAALEEKLTLAEQHAHDHWDKLVRATAEVDNIRRRAERDVTNAHRYALEKFIDTLLPVVDSLEHALVLAEKKEDATLHEGLELTMRLLLGVLNKADVRQVDPQGLPFNPQEHEAMSIQETEDVAPNTVLTVFQKGYVLNDRMIRPARVIVSKEKKHV